MQLTAYLLGDPGRMPFVGHFRVGIHTEQATLAAAGRVAGGSGVVPGFRAARAVEAALMGLSTTDVLDRHDLLRRAWTTLFDVAACDLGPEVGADLTVFFAVRDAKGMGVAGVGLAGVWGWSGPLDPEPVPLVEGAHPLLGAAGLPAVAPGVLTLDTFFERVVAVPAHLQPVLPRTDSLPRRCGVRV